MDQEKESIESRVQLVEYSDQKEKLAYLGAKLTDSDNFQLLESICLSGDLIQLVTKTNQATNEEEKKDTLIVDKGD